jgi:hypothetical protein
MTRLGFSANTSNSEREAKDIDHMANGLGQTTTADRKLRVEGIDAEEHS